MHCLVPLPVIYPFVTLGSQRSERAWATRLIAGLLLGLAVLLVTARWAGAVAEPAAGQQGSYLILAAPEERRFRAYVAGPEDAPAGILLVHDYFGISDFTRRAVERLGAMGYRTLAVDLYDGRSTTSDQEASELMQALDPQVTDAILQSGLDYLKGAGRKIATLGFSMGGRQALIAGLNDPQAVAATVMVYGGSYQDLEARRLAALNGPVLAITGLADDWARSSAVRFLDLARNQGIDFGMYMHPGVGHAYAQPLFNGGANYDPAATRTTWLLVDDFLSRHLSPPR